MCNEIFVGDCRLLFFSLHVNPPMYVLDGHFESFVVFIIVIIHHHHVAKTLFNFVLLYKTENNKQRKKERKKERKKDEE